MLQTALIVLLTIAAQPSQSIQLPVDPQDDWARAYRGVSRPSEVRELAFPVRGRVVEVMVDPGEIVAAGRPLMRLEDDLERATLELARIRAEDTSEIESAQTRYRFRKQDYELTLESNQAGGASLGDLREAKFLFDQAAIDLDIARREQAEEVITLTREQARLDQRTIRSPMEGSVVDVLKNPGEGVDELTAVITLIDIDPLVVEINLPTAMALRVKPGLGAEIRWEDLPGFEPVMGEVVFRAPAGHAGVRSIPVRVEVPNPGQLPSGMHARVRLIADESADATDRER